MKIDCIAGDFNIDIFNKNIVNNATSDNIVNQEYLSNLLEYEL